MNVKLSSLNISLVTEMKASLTLKSLGLYIAGARNLININPCENRSFLANRMWL